MNKTDIINKIISSHNPDLINIENNIIYHIYSNGMITSQMSGRLYLRREMEIEIEPLNIGVNFDSNEFNFVIEDDNNIYYCIVLEQDAYLIRNMLIKYYTK